MVLVNIKPLGWAYGEIFTSAQANSITSQLPNAIDGAGGGSYSLAAPLVIADDTVTISDGLIAPTISGATEFTGAVTFSNDIEVDGGDVIINSPSGVMATNIPANHLGFTTYQGTLELDGAVTVNGVLSFNTPYVESLGTTVPGGTKVLGAYTNFSLSSGGSTTTTWTSAGIATGTIVYLNNGSGASQTFAGTLVTTLADTKTIKIRYNGTSWSIVAGPF